MTCYHCNKNEADNRFWVNFMGYSGEVHLCSDCLEKIVKYTSGMMRNFQKGVEDSEFEPEWFYGPFPMGYEPEEQVTAHILDDAPIPQDAGEEIRQRRKLGEMRAKLQHAIQQEDYERAAQLRDEIEKLESGVRVYDA